MTAGHRLRWGCVMGLLAAACGAVAYAGAATSGDPAAGKAVFQSNGCIGCHTLGAVSAVGRIGPNLDQTKPTFDVVVARVTSGKGLMPAFGARLSDTQIGDVAAFVVQATGGTPPARPDSPSPAAPASPTAPGSPGAPTAVKTLPSSVIVTPVVRGLRATTARVAAGAVSVRVRNTRRRPLVVAMLLPTKPGAAPTSATSHLHSIPPRRARTMKVRLGAGETAAVCRLEPRLGHPCVNIRGIAPPAAPAPQAAVPTLAATPPPPPPPPPPDGKTLFLATCGSCHTLADAGTTGTFGPNLDSKRPDAGEVRSQVLSGGNGMPPFQGVLSSAEIDLVAEYVARVTRR